MSFSWTSDTGQLNIFFTWDKCENYARDNRLASKYTYNTYMQGTRALLYIYRHANAAILHNHTPFDYVCFTAPWLTCGMCGDLPNVTKFCSNNNCLQQKIVGIGHFTLHSFETSRYIFRDSWHIFANCSMWPTGQNRAWWWPIWRLTYLFGSVV